MNIRVEEIAANVRDVLPPLLVAPGSDVRASSVFPGDRNV